MNGARAGIVVVMAGVLAVGRAWAGPPTDEVKATVDQVLHILESPEYQGDAHTRERRKAIREAVSKRFSFSEMAKRTLGPHWAERTPAERDEFVRLLTDLLEASYIHRIEGYSGEQISYVGESVDGEHAEVRSKVLTKGREEVPLNYRLVKDSGQWQVYDITIEGVSLVNNYRTQFNRIINSSSYGALLSRMRAEAASVEAEHRTPRPSSLTPPPAPARRAGPQPSPPP
jgi:phospholipid transport system substrate-binding protein